MVATAVWLAESSGDDDKWCKAIGLRSKGGGAWDGPMGIQTRECQVDLSYLTVQCNGDMSSDGFPAWAFVKRSEAPIHAEARRRYDEGLPEDDVGIIYSPG
ncbi:hypothetical protein L6452_31122 [Arctium lappa]|uniref:Uncharacterized protein n=1 Tax=Arctium lappa TaxID=4217 RepID=A0ACB8ZL80_ARCLA|nr:hypothetical protein L6452_31122 [Arctium lappa]